MNKKELLSLVFLLGITVYFGGTLASYIVIENATYGVTELLLIIALLIAWGQFFTWHSRKEVQKDEMGKQIIRNSASISYQIVFVVLLILWIYDFFFVTKGANYTLFIALCVALITNPILQFIQVKKYL